MNEELARLIEALPLLDLILIGIANLPTWLGTLLVIGVPVLLSALGVLLTNWLLGSEVLIDNNIVGGAKLAFLAQVFCALLAFVIIDGALRYNEVRANIQTEVSALRLYMETLDQLSAPEARDMGRLVKAYADQVVTQEYRTMQLGAESAAARAAMKDLLEGYLLLPARNEHERLLKLQADQLLAKAMEGRAGRLNAVRPGLKTLIWTVVVLNLALAISFNWFFGNPSLAMQMLMAMLLTAAIMILTYLALLLYHPFAGEFANSPAPYAVLRLR